MQTFHVQKASGELESFDQAKLIRSLQRSGAKPDAIEFVISRLLPLVREGIATKDLYRRTFQLLKKYRRPLAARYSLKPALVQLGPEGFAFEKFVGAIFRKQGFEVSNDIFLDGKCVTHEIDVFARKGDTFLLAECKFHRSNVSKCDIKTALYVHARAVDVAQGPKGVSFTDFRLVTNGKFSSDAEKYAACSRLGLLGWAYPPGHGLRELAAEFSVHPLTCLTTLTAVQKKRLLSFGAVTCEDLVNDPSLLRRASIPEKDVDPVLGEIESIAEKDHF